MNLKKSIKDLPDEAFSGKRVLVRADFNVPMNPDGTIASDYRITETLPTLQYLMERQARIIIATHFGRPKAGQLEDKYKLKPIVEALRQLLPGTKIHYFDHLIDDETRRTVDALQPGEILVLENIRFEPGETDNDEALSRKLSELADIYVNDAFGAAHRAHASTEGVAHLVPAKVSGLLMRRELYALQILSREPEKPFTAIIGGSKVSSKIGVLKQLLSQVNNIVIGGGMLFTFLKAKGYPVGASLVEDDYIDVARDFLEEAQASDCFVLLPRDIVVADRFAPDAQHRIVLNCDIPEGWMGLDVAPDSVERICELVKNSKTVFWNGPMGVFEFPAFANATRQVAEVIADTTRSSHLTSVLGGGDTQAAIEMFNMNPADFTHVSTGGGASLEFLEGKVLPGVSVLEDKAPAPMGV